MVSTAELEKSPPTGRRRTPCSFELEPCPLLDILNDIRILPRECHAIRHGGPDETTKIC